MEKKQLSLHDLAIILTVLDRDAHNAHYGISSRESGATRQYIEDVHEIQVFLIGLLPMEVRIQFAESHPHLAHFFIPDPMGSQGNDE